MSTVRTTCPYCGVGCGLKISDGVFTGDTEHPANFGRLCSKGAALKDTLATHDRLKAPTIGEREVSWDAALETVAQGFRDVIAQHGPEAVAFYVSGQFLTEDYYVANKLMKGFMGAANIDTNSRLCMASSVAGHIRAFGEDIVPGCYDDLEETDLAVIVGSNMAWCHPVLFQRLMAAREKRGTKIVVIDPRRTATCEGVDLHLPLAAGSDVLLFNGLFAHLSEAGAIDQEWVAAHVNGLAQGLEAARGDAVSIDDVARGCDLDPVDLKAFYDLFAHTERVVTFYSQGVNQSTSGTDKVNAIINCHLATGRIGRAGMGPFSLTGQPNAMGGREVGGLANQLAAHMGFPPEDVDRVRRFWQAPNMATQPGLKAVDLFRAVGEGKIKAIWIAATNPAVSMPRANAVRDALARCPLVVVSDAWATDTTALAHIVLPAAAWAEKDGTVTNSERRISRQRAFRAAPGLTRPDWWMFAEVGRRMGWGEAFAYPNPASIFREHAALSCFENAGRRLFDLGGLAALDEASYDALEPVQWPYPKTPHSAQRLFARGGFCTDDGKARIVPVRSSSRGVIPGQFTLNTGRIRDQWHTMTRTGRAAQLMGHISMPRLAIHPRDAATLGLDATSLAEVTNQHGTTVLPVEITTQQRLGEVFAPMHWTRQFSSAGAIDGVVHENPDPISGQPDLKGGVVFVRPLLPTWRGWLVRRSGEPPAVGETAFWAKRPVQNGFVFEFTGWTPLREVAQAEEELRQLLGVSTEAELLSYSDAKRQTFRYAGLEQSQLEACLFLSLPEVPAPDTGFPASALGRTLNAMERLSLLANANPVALDAQDIVCACFGVGRSSIVAAIHKGDLNSVAAVGGALKAGTNCGSCVPEIKNLLQRGPPAPVALTATG